MKTNICTVHVASPLRSYTKGATKVIAKGASLQEVLADLDQQFPGMRFRMIDEQNHIREHIRLSINTQMTNDLMHPLKSGDVLHLICALSGG